MTAKEEYAVQSVKHLRETLGYNADSFALIGLLLKEAKGYFKDLPDTCYKNIYEFAKTELSLCKTTTKYYLAIHTKFCDGQKVKDEFKEYNYSQLREMVKLSDEDMCLVNISMTCKDIARLCKELSKQRQTSDDKIIEPFIEKEPQVKPVKFNNNDERLDFLKNYTTWELYKEVKELDLKFYKANLSNGAYIIATESLFGRSLFGNDYYFNHVTPIAHWCVIDPNNEESKYDITGAGGISIIAKYMSANKVSYIPPKPSPIKSEK